MDGNRVRDRIKAKVRVRVNVRIEVRVKVRMRVRDRVCDIFNYQEFYFNQSEGSHASVISQLKLSTENPLCF